MIAQVMNSSKKQATVRLDWHGSALSLKLPALSITTCLWK
jgi:hypothetical protein